MITSPGPLVPLHAPASQCPPKRSRQMWTGLGLGWKSGLEEGKSYSSIEQEHLHPLSPSTAKPLSTPLPTTSHHPPASKLLARPSSRLFNRSCYHYSAGKCGAVELSKTVFWSPKHHSRTVIENFLPLLINKHNISTPYLRSYHEYSPEGDADLQSLTSLRIAVIDSALSP